MPSQRPNNLLNIPPARFLAKPPEYKVLDARLEAWLNLSHLENATVFVIVRIKATTGDIYKSCAATIFIWES